jgi:hypothetical protein
MPETVTISGKMRTTLAQDDSILTWFGGEEKKTGSDAGLLLFLYYFYFTGLRETTMPSIFLGQVVGLVWVEGISESFGA